MFKRKMTPLTLAMAAAAVALAGCDTRANKYENLCREYATLVEKDGNGIKAPTEDDIKRELERFSALSEDEQDKLIEEAEEKIRIKKIP